MRILHIAAVIVSYEPDFALLRRLVDSLMRQVGSVFIVDNGTSTSVVEWANDFFDEGVQVIPLEDNFGIAAAQNRGIACARKSGAKYVVLFDQDSEPADDMICLLWREVAIKEGEGKRIGGVGPRYIDERQDNPPPFIQVRGFSVKRKVCGEGSRLTEVDYLIASGCLIPLSTLDFIGGMREDLFIDYVDIEWGLRAKAAGFQSYGAFEAKMKHDLGDAPIEFRGVHYPARSPLRHYYMFRNATFLYARTSLPFNWKVADGWRLVLKYFFYILFARPRLTHFRMMTLGVWDGLMGRMGRCSR